jgi:hypothetical protein
MPSTGRNASTCDLMLPAPVVFRCSLLPLNRFRVVKNEASTHDSRAWAKAVRSAAVTSSSPEGSSMRSLDRESVRNIISVEVAPERT